MKKTFTLEQTNNSNLLMLVKIIKSYTGDGLRNTKNFVDFVREGKGKNSIELDLSFEQETNFIKELDSLVGVKYTIHNKKELIRNIQFAQLGLIDDKKELIDIISKFSNLTEVLELIPNEMLINIIEFLNKKYLCTK